MTVTLDLSLPQLQLLREALRVHIQQASRGAVDVPALWFGADVLGAVLVQLDDVVRAGEAS